jgi:hypothetical protein
MYFWPPKKRHAVTWRSASAFVACLILCSGSRGGCGGDDGSAANSGCSVNGDCGADRVCLSGTCQAAPAGETGWCAQLRVMCPADWNTAHGACTSYCGTAVPTLASPPDCKFAWCTVQIDMCDAEDFDDTQVQICEANHGW